MYMIKRIVFATIISQLLACSSTTVVLLPDSNENSKLIVTTEAGKQIVDSTANMTRITSASSSPSIPVKVSLETITTQHAKLFSAQPQKEESFLLYFEHSSTKLLPKSEQLLTKILNSAQLRKAPLIHIIGHADASGEEEFNFKLSVRRAKVVLNKIHKANIKGVQFHVDSYGETDLLVHTGPKQQQQNRRVEVRLW